MFDYIQLTHLQDSKGDEVKYAVLAVKGAMDYIVRV